MLVETTLKYNIAHVCMHCDVMSNLALIKTLANYKMAHIHSQICCNLSGLHSICCLQYKISAEFHTASNGHCGGLGMRLNVCIHAEKKFSCTLRLVSMEPEARMSP